MIKNIIYVVFILYSTSTLAKAVDYKGLPFLDENLKIGLGLSYSKLEIGSELGNYFLLSQANPRFEIKYDTARVANFSQRFDFFLEQMLYRPENANLKLKYVPEFYSYGVAWKPRWISSGEGFAYGTKLQIKSAAVISEQPDVFDIYGDIATRYSLEAGGYIVWFGQTVAKLPMSIDFELLYSATLADNSALDYQDGTIYRFGIEFDFGKRSVLSNWNVRGHYSYEDLKNDYKNFVDKEIGITVNKIFFF